MKRLLLLSDPPASPGYLPRVRYLCDYLVRQGYDVTWLTEQYQPLDFEHPCPIETIRMYSGGTFDWFIKTVWTYSPTGITGLLRERRYLPILADTMP